MALVTCPDCGKEVSDAAAACPGCARPMAQAGPQRVTTAEDSALTRSRGCADLIIWPFLIGGLIVVVMVASKSCAG